MDINDIRSLTTMLGFLLFLALVRRAWSRSALAAQDQASRLVFEGETSPESSTAREVRHG